MCSPVHASPCSEHSFILALLLNLSSLLVFAFCISSYVYLKISCHHSSYIHLAYFVRRGKHSAHNRQTWFALHFNSQNHFLIKFPVWTMKFLKFLLMRHELVLYRHRHSHYIYVDKLATVCGMQHRPWCTHEPLLWQRWPTCVLLICSSAHP